MEPRLPSCDRVEGHVFARLAAVLVAAGTVCIAGSGPAQAQRNEQVKLTASDAWAGDLFGISVAVSGDYALVGAHGADPAGSESGAAYVYHFDGMRWAQQAKLVASDGVAMDRFGTSVSLSGDYAAVGAYWDDDAGVDSGSVYIFHRSGSTWSQQAKLTAPGYATKDEFGYAVSLNGDHLVVGAPYDNAPQTDSGSAYVFHRNGSTWTQQAKLTASDAASSDFFGHDVAISGDYLVVGAAFNDDAGMDSGSAYVFHFDGNSWAEQAKLVASDAAATDYFGTYVSISGDDVAVGAPWDDASAVDSGSAYVFRRSGTTWTQQAKLTPSDAAAGDLFGSDVSIRGDNLVIGAVRDDVAGVDSGSAYLFRRDGATWGEHAKLVPSDGAAGDNFGMSASISSDDILVGSYHDDDAGADCGSAYLYTILPPGDTWWQAPPAGAGSWAVIANWTLGVPFPATNAHIENGGTAQILTGTAATANVLSIGVVGSGTLQWLGGTLDASEIHVGPNGLMSVAPPLWTYTGRLVVDGGTLVAAGTIQLDGGGRGELTGGTISTTGNFVVGAATTGQFTQTDGLLDTLHLYVGANAGSKGAYTMDDGQVQCVYLRVGYQGEGAFTQTGGTVTVAGQSAEVGQLAGSEGTYELRGGQLSGKELHVGKYSRGTFTQTGGDVRFSHVLCLGWRSGGDGSYELIDGNVTLQGVYGALYVGVLGKGTFVQRGGRIDANSLTLGYYACPDRGTYEMSGGDLTVSEEARIGLSGTGAFAQTGGTFNAGSVDVGCGLGSDGRYDLANGQLTVAGDLHVGRFGTGTFTQVGGSVHAGGDLYLGTDANGDGSYAMGGGEVRCRKLHVGLDGTGTFAQSGGTVLAGRLYVAPVGGKGSGVMQLVGGRIYLTGDGEPNDPESTIGGALAGYGTIISGGPVTIPRGAAVLALGGALIIDGEIDCDANVGVLAGAALRTRGCITGAVHNAGTLAAHNGELHVLANTVVNTGTLANDPLASLFIGAVSLDHTGDIAVNAGGGVSFDQAITNGPGRQIALHGGVLSAAGITNAPDGNMTGTGEIAADLTNQGTADFFGPMRIFGDVRNDPNGWLGLRNGDLLVTGHTTNDGTIKVTNGRACFEGGLTDNGTVDIDPALAVVVGDLCVGTAGILIADANSTLQLHGDFLNSSRQKTEFDLAAGRVQFHGLAGLAGPQALEAAGADVGPDPAGWADNFAFGVFRIEPGARVALFDNADNHADGPGNEAVYVGDLELVVAAPGGVASLQGWIDLNGVNLYYLNGEAPKKLFYADTNLDGDVDFADYIACKGAFGTMSGATWFTGDTDGDGDVDFVDYITAKGNFGSTTGGSAAGPPAVPEPATLLLLAAGACLPLLRRQRR